MFKNLKWAMVMVAALSVLGLAEPGAAKDRVKIRIGYAAAIESIIGKASTKLATMAERLSQGKIEIKILPNSQLGNEPAMVSQVRQGVLDMVIVRSRLAAGIEPTLAIAELPFIWKSHESALEVLNGRVGDEVLALMEPKGIKGLAWGVVGFHGMLTNGFAIDSTVDMKKRKIGTVRNPMHHQMIHAFGGNPVPMAWSEVSAAFNRKIIEGVETSYHGMAVAKQYKFATHLAVSNHIFTTSVYLMNLKVYNSLSPQHKEIIIRAARADGKAMRDSARNINENAIKLMTEHDIIVTRPERETFADSAQAVHKGFLRDQSHNGELIRRAFKAATQSVGGGNTCTYLACGQGQECCDGECKDSCS